MSVEIRRVSGKSDMRKFVKFSIELYAGNPYYVPGLISEDMNTLDPEKNPAFEFCKSAYFLAYRDGKIVGRIAGIINEKANETWNENRARFGFVDFIDDNEVVDALFGAVIDWAKSEGKDAIHGPMGFTDLDYEGMLIAGFDQLSTMATIYNYAYYPKQLERIGFVKDQDWFEYKVFVPDAIPEKHQRISEIVQRKYGLKVVKFRSRKEIMAYADQIFQTLNESYAQLYGYSELSKAQIDAYVRMYIPLVRLEYITVIIREEDDKVVGFGISIPSLSKALQKAKGKLFPFGWYHLLKALRGEGNDVIDLYLVGVIPEYQNKGVNALLFNDLIPIYQKHGIRYGESHPQLETNMASQMQFAYFEREHHKTRRAYIKHL